MSAKRFSLLYLQESDLVRDSERARFRVAKMIDDHVMYYGGRGSARDIHTASLEKKIERELGIRFRSRGANGGYHPIWSWYTKRIDLRDFLDTVTVVIEYFFSQDNREILPTKDKGPTIRDNIRRVFAEERMSFRIDDDGSVHPIVDESFQANLSSAVRAVSGERYTATASALNAMEDALKSEVPDYISAIRAIFSANENLFKLRYGGLRLDARSVSNNLPKDLTRIANDRTDQTAGDKMVEAYKDWTNAAHFYRHEAGVEQPRQPSEHQALLMLSLGISFLRWLAQIDQSAEKV